MKFLKEWGPFSLVVLLIIALRLWVWSPVVVDGHSMDPTLADKDHLVIIRTAQINRFDIVVAKETDDTGKTKNIVKRVVGMPGDTVTYKNDQLYINGKKTDEPYLADYQKAFKDKSLVDIYSYNAYFQDIARTATAFTLKDGLATFTVHIPEGQYFLLGDDRLVSNDSRSVGTFKKSAIEGEVKFRTWPLKSFGPMK